MYPEVSKRIDVALNSINVGSLPIVESQRGTWVVHVSCQRLGVSAQRYHRRGTLLALGRAETLLALTGATTGGSGLAWVDRSDAVPGFVQAAIV